MQCLRFVLMASTVVIFAVTFIAVVSSGYNWPVVFTSDLLAGNWRSQFNTDLVIHLALIGVWVAWRERWGFRGLIFGFFCVLWGGMFTFPYLLIESFRARGDVKTTLLGSRA